jgi:hypothetical protein
VLLALTVLGQEVVFLDSLEPKGHLPFKILEAGQGGAVSAQVELLSTEVFTEVVQCLHDDQQLPLGNTAVSLGLVHSLTGVNFYLFLAILNL